MWQILGARTDFTGRPGHSWQKVSSRSAIFAPRRSFDADGVRWANCHGGHRQSCGSQDEIIELLRALLTGRCAQNASGLAGSFAPCSIVSDCFVGHDLAVATA